MTDWPEYKSHKIVRAAPIYQIIEVRGSLHILVKPGDDHRVERFEPTEPAMLARAEVGGYAVIYEDGYKSVSPAEAFEDGYTRVTKPANPWDRLSASWFPELPPEPWYVRWFWTNRARARRDLKTPTVPRSPSTRRTDIVRSMIDSI